MVWWRGDDICRHEMEGRLLLDVVIGKVMFIFRVPAVEMNEASSRRHGGRGISRAGIQEECRLLLDVVVGKGMAIFQAACCRE